MYLIHGILFICIFYIMCISVYLIIDFFFIGSRRKTLFVNFTSKTASAFG
jgi:hypothetical protein